jgi:hypothetical protein
VAHVTPFSEWPYPQLHPPHHIHITRMGYRAVRPPSRAHAAAAASRRCSYLYPSGAMQWILVALLCTMYGPSLSD